MANYSPQHFEPRAKAVNVKGVANRAVATVLTAGLIAQPLMSPLAAIAAPSTDNGDSVQGGGSSVENTVAAGNQAVVKTAAQLAEESAKQLKDAQAAYDAAQKKADAAGQSQKQAQQQKNQASQAVTDNAAEQNEAEAAALQEKIDELKAAVDKAEQQQKKLGDLNDQLDQANKSVEDKTQALKDAKAKQDEAKKALDDAQAKLEAMGMDEYEAAKKAVEDAQAKLNAANADVKTAEGELDAAKTAADNAEQAKSDAESALTTAQAKKQETANALAAATTACGNAQDKLNDAQKALDAAISGTGIDLKALEAAKEAAAGELKDAQTELDAAKAADATAQTNLQAAQTDASAAQEKVNAANAAVSSAQTAYDEANGKLGDLTSKYNTAKAAYEQAQQTEADKKTEYDRLAEVAKQKKSALENATSDYNKANDEYNTASANVKALEQQISELKANMTVDTDAVKAGLLGFMNHIASSTSFTAAQRANASDAAKLLDGSASKAAWYDDYVNLDASDADNAFSLVNLQNTLTYMNAVNGIRRANGLSDMKVSIVSMAQSALDVCYSSNVWDHAGNSGEGFYMSYNENLAGRAGAYKGSDNPKDWEISFDNGDKYGDDWPFIGWYTAEKRDYDRGDYSNTGHYENFIDSGANSFGFAVGYGKDGNRSTPEDDGAPSPVSIYHGNWAEGDFTVDEFKNLVNTYVDSVYHAGGTAAQKAQLAQLQDQLAAARKALDVKNDALGSAESSLDAAKSAANEANGNVAAAKSDYEAAQ